MTGVVNDSLEATLRLSVLDSSGTPNEIEAVIDTGFTGFLTLPHATTASLNLHWLCRQRGQLADGSFHDFEVYKATVIWNGRPRNIEAESAEATPLLGMELMENHELRIVIRPGGVVSIVPVV